MRTGSGAQGQEHVELGTIGEGPGLAQCPALTLAHPVCSRKPPPVSADRVLGMMEGASLCDSFSPTPADWLRR